MLSLFGQQEMLDPASYRMNTTLSDIVGHARHPIHLEGHQ